MVRSTLRSFPSDCGLSAVAVILPAVDRTACGDPTLVCRVYRGYTTTPLERRRWNAAPGAAAVSYAETSVWSGV
jgi:hypothetical protein